MAAPELLAGHACLGGARRFHRHDPRSIVLPMRISILPHALLPMRGDGKDGPRLGLPPLYRGE